MALDSTLGSEIVKARPCVILSPDEMNRPLKTVIAAPLTRTCKNWPTRYPITFSGKQGEVALDQIRTLSKQRLVKRLGQLPHQDHASILSILREMFS